MSKSALQQTFWAPIATWNILWEPLVIIVRATCGSLVPVLDTAGPCMRFFHYIAAFAILLLAGNTQPHENEIWKKMNSVVQKRRKEMKKITERRMHEILFMVIFQLFSKSFCKALCRLKFYISQFGCHISYFVVFRVLIRKMWCCFFFCKMSRILGWRYLEIYLGIQFIHSNIYLRFTPLFMTLLLPCANDVKFNQIILFILP